MLTSEQENQNADSAEDARVELAGDDAKKGGYQVGYKHPPLQTRFKPGKSGNPKGRPKGTPNHRTAVNKVMNEKISLREGDKKRRMTKFEALLQAQANKGMKGDARSAGMVINLMGKAGLLGEQADAPKVNNDSEAKKAFTPMEEGPRLGDNLFKGIDDNRLTEDEMIELAKFAKRVDTGGIVALSTRDFERVKELQSKGRRQDRAAA